MVFILEGNPVLYCVSNQPGSPALPILEAGMLADFVWDFPRGDCGLGCLGGVGVRGKLAACLSNMLSWK